jgi:hypothetical protein
MLGALRMAVRHRHDVRWRCFPNRALLTSQFSVVPSDGFSMTGNGWGPAGPLIERRDGAYHYFYSDPNSTSGFLVPSYYVFAQNDVNRTARGFWSEWQQGKRSSERIAGRCSDGLYQVLVIIPCIVDVRADLIPLERIRRQ